MYIDTDAHHGDGVQASFYDDPNVCTVSIHETGRYLFPGTGDVNERGQGAGYGYSFNVPLDAFTEDESFSLHISYANSGNCGLLRARCYSHAKRCRRPLLRPSYPPLRYHQYLSRNSKKIAHEIAHEYCNGRWIAVGGGGYDIWRVVPRAWSLIWLEMNHMRNIASGLLPLEWVDAWKQQAPVQLPLHWEDPENMYKSIPRKKRRLKKKTIYP
ncbi:hypothetical protein GCM10020331_031400 [Ectobacillus funiculus]